MTEQIADHREREEALDPSRSFIVQAPAGSGKTELLMQRYLVLLSLAERPEQILAVTFTRKAAGEMQNRIVEALRKARAGREPRAPHEKKTMELARAVLGRDSALGWELLDNPGRLRIQTMDALSSGIARLAPLVSRLGNGTAISEMPEDLYREAAERTVEMVEEESPGGEAVRKALSHLDNSVRGLSERLVEMLGKRDQWHRHVQRRDGEDLMGLLEGSLRSLVEAELGGIREKFPAGIEARLIWLARYAAANLISRGSDSPVAALDGIAAVPGAKAADLPMWKGVKELLLTGKGELRKPNGINAGNGFPADKTPKAVEAKEAFKALLEDLAADAGSADFLAALSGAEALPEPRFGQRDRDMLEALLRLLPLAERQLEAVFAERRETDHQAVAMAALEALGSELDPTDLMLSLDMRLRHILVDEYQDTSRSQLCLLEALTRGWEPGDGRTLFIVGDPMQSIYLFREAQVGLFLEAASRGVGQVRLDFLRLRTNFRSTAGIVGWVNGTFAPAFPDIEDSFTGSISYSPSVAVREGGRDSVSVRLYAARDDAFEAGEAVSVIKSLPPGDTAAVLCRARGHVAAVVEALKREGIDFRAQDIDPMAGRPVIQDLLTLLRALAHPYDRVAWLAALRAPWCGLSLSDLHALAGCDRGTPVWRLANDGARLSALSPDGRKRLERTARLFGKAIGLWGRTDVRSVVEGLWIELGGPACAGDGPSMKDAEAFFALLAPLGSVAGQSEIRALEERLGKLYAGHGGGADTRVDVMTVHKAKGLEFDHVIIPGLGKKARRERKKLLLWMERGDGLLLAPVPPRRGNDKSPVYDYLSSVNGKRAEFERARMLYVAATRARKGLHLFGHTEESKGGPRAASDSFLSVIAHAVDMGSAVSPPQAPEPEGPGGARAMARLPLSWALPQPAPAVGLAPAAGRRAAQEAEFHWAGEVRRRIGTVAHRYLCRIAGEGPDKWDAARVTGEARRMEAMLRTLGLSAGAARDAAAECARIIRRALSEERGRWALSAHEEGSVEEPVTGVVDGEIVRAVIDRTFVEDGVRWVVDYKTGTHEGGSLEGFLASERQRYAPQLALYAALLSAGGERREIRKGLYYPALGAWVEL